MGMAFRCKRKLAGSERGGALRCRQRKSAVLRGYFPGAPELVVEIAASSASIDVRESSTPTGAWASASNSSGGGGARDHPAKVGDIASTPLSRSKRERVAAGDDLREGRPAHARRAEGDDRSNPIRLQSRAAAICLVQG